MRARPLAARRNAQDVKTQQVREDDYNQPAATLKEHTMTTSGFPGQGGHPVPLVPIAVDDENKVNPRVDDTHDATADEVSEESGVVAGLDDPEVDAAIEKLRGEGA